MTKPTPPEKAYAWHGRALIAKAANERLPAVHENDPQPGWYMRRLVRDGEMVPCRIWIESDVGEDGHLTAPERILCEVDGRPADASQQWTWLANRPISEDAYMDMLARKFAAKEPSPTEMARKALEGVAVPLDQPRPIEPGPEPVVVHNPPKSPGVLF